ncbi:MAG: flippase [Acetobacteraceae bacterium]|nr:flippase [Acetobacteraceae bacterium]
MPPVFAQEGHLSATSLVPDGDGGTGTRMTDHEERREALTGTRVLARSTLWNIIGRLGPMVVALLATPLLVHKLGVPRWGVFTLALSLVGMFGVFDFGVGRVLARTVAEHLGEGRGDEAASVVWTGTVLVTIFGVVGALLGSLFVPYLVRSVLTVPPELHRQTILGLYVLAAAGPLIVLNGALWGVMSAFQKFAAANLANIPVLVMYYLGPLAILYVYDSLIGVMAVLVVCRAAITVAYWMICLRSMPALRNARFDLGAIRPMLAFGSWITVSNVIYPVMLYLDRFVIGSLLSVSATAYYATPADLMNRFWLVPIAVMNAVFPAMATEFRADPARTAAMLRRSMIFISATVFPGCLCAIVLPGPLLEIWLGHDFSQHAAPILRWFGIGMFIQCLVFVPAGLLDSLGRFDITAKLLAAETAIFIPLLFLLVSKFGIEGAACAWLIRVSLAFGASLTMAGRLYPPVRAEIWRVLPVLAAGLVLMALPLLASALIVQLALMAFVMLTYLALLWLHSLTMDERRQLGVTFARFARI